MHRVDRLQMKLADKVNNLVTAPSRRRETPVQFRARVAGVEELSAHQRRITLTAPEFADFALTGPDEYFGLLIPHPAAGLVMPDPHRLNTRQAVHRIAEHERPELRWYSVRAHRPAVCEIDVDFVLHEHAGPGTRWAAGARQGDEVGFRGGGSGYQRSDGTQVLVADEAALPALSAILEALPAEAPDLRVYLEVGADFAPSPIAAAVQPTVLRRDGEHGEQVVAALVADPPAAPEFAWVCGEAGMVARVRRHLLHECGMDRRQVLYSGYWKLGQARG
ncbi:siderophore-interacting protein [Actinokineospora sp. NPDC004072]